MVHIFVPKIYVQEPNAQKRDSFVPFRRPIPQTVSGNGTKADSPKIERVWILDVNCT